MSAAPSPSAASLPERTDVARLFAAFLALSVLMLTTRLLMLGPQSWLLLPIVSYQDLLFVSLLAWTFGCALSRLTIGWRRSAVVIVGWSVCLLASAIASIHLIIFSYIRQPLTLRLIELSGNLGGVEGTVSESVSAAGNALVVSPLLVLLLAIFCARFIPSPLARMERGFRTPGVAVVVVVLSFAAHYYVTYRIPPNAWPFAENPEWAFACSLFTSKPVVTDRIPDAYLDDFRPPSARRAAPVSRSAVVVPFEGRAHSMNVLLVIMESVGVNRLQLYGAPYDDSPQLTALARHGVRFQRVYASQPLSSSAMAGLFCSIYPGHDFLAITRRSPDLRVTGLPALLASHGYRTAFMRLGNLAYDNDGDFLKDHGFADVIGEPRDYDRPMDAKLLPDALEWIQRDRTRPFFLALWTVDTHHPYPAQVRYDYAAGAPMLNRYLNGIRQADDLIAQLADALNRRGLADNTLLIVTGDHGEGFLEHGQQAHGFTVYDEEVHVPFLIVNPRLFPLPRVENSLGRQIDIAPTILGLLGIPRPREWQGEDLFSSVPRRAYLFESESDFTLGLIDGETKYLDHFNSGRMEMYDMEDDPQENRNLAASPGNAPALALAHLRMEAWLFYQNAYLAKFLPKSAPR